MPEKEVDIPSKVRSYQGYPELIEFDGCPRCNSLDVNPKIVNFKKNNIRFQVTCLKCGLLYHARENIDSNNRKTIVIEWDF